MYMDADQLLYDPDYHLTPDDLEDAMLTETDDNRPTYMWTSDRTRQVDYVRELAGELISSQKFVSVDDYADAETYAETIVTDYLERMAEQHEPMPDWWDEHDRGLLVRFIADTSATDDPDEDDCQPGGMATRARLEHDLTMHHYLYYRANGQAYAHSDSRIPEIEGRQATFMRDSRTGTVVRFENGTAIPVTDVEYYS